MSAKDRFHQAVKTGLIKDGWTITHDPLSLDMDKLTQYRDWIQRVLEKYS